MLQCKASSVGAVRTQQNWERERGEAVRGDDRVFLFSDGTLLVTDARLGEDSGTYNCVASNTYGTSTASSDVTVLRKFIVIVNIMASIHNVIIYRDASELNHHCHSGEHCCTALWLAG